MKKLFTLVALLACFLGAKAEVVTDYSIDYSTYNGFPFYVMGYVPEWFDGVMTDFGAMYKYVKVADDAEETSDVIVKTNDGTEYYKIELAEAAWHQYFIADGIPTELDGAYTVKAMVKASEACTINVNMGWGWSDGQSLGASVAIGTEWQEVEWSYNGIGGTSCNLVAQPGGCTATIEWKSLTVSHTKKQERPTTWQEWLTSDGKSVVVETTPDAIPTFMGNAETPWADANVRFDDTENNYLICAWGKENGVNVNGDGGSDPFPATIELEEGTQNHVFVVHAKDCTDPSADASAWDNQFWIESPKAWKEGEQLKIHFRYKASQPAKTNTQVHHQNPSNYQHWMAIGDINFTTEWQEFDKVISWPNGAGDDAWSIAFNLNPEVKNATDFYFDDLSWQSMVLDEGLFIAACNTNTGLEYDFDNATEFTYNEDLEAYVAVVGEKGKENTYVNEVMVSTVRGNDAAFKSNTLKPVSVSSDPDEWVNYTTASLSKIKLPGEGVWQVAVDTDGLQMNFVMLEGVVSNPIDVVTNSTPIVVKAVERDDLTDGTKKDDDGNDVPDIKEEEGGTGQPWDNQFWFKANRTLAKGEVTHLVFKYKASKEAKTTTQCHGNPGAYMHWAAIGDVNFTTEWQDFDQDFTVPAEADGMQTIAFNMAEIREACDYEITDVQWYLVDTSLEAGKTWENLINATGTENFWVKIGAGTEPYQYVDATGINEVAAKNAKSSNVSYNLAGQRVSDSFKGIVVKDGKKFVK